MTHSLPLSTYSAPGGLRQGPRRAAESPAEAGICGNGESRSACAVVDVGIARGRRTAGGTRGGVAGTRRGGAGVRAAGRGVHGAADDRPDAGRRALGGRETGHPLRVRVLPSVRTAVAALPSAVAAGPALPGGGNRPQGAVGAGRPARERAVRRGGEQPPRPRADRGVDPARRTPAPGRAGGVPGGGRTAGVRGLRQQGRRVLPARGWADLAPIDDVDDCFVVGEVNQRALFGRVAAVVRHGGAGTTTAAARAGAPQVVVPRGPWPPRSAPTGRRWPRSFSST
ncbi:hypothetical protein BX281_8013 [Streptomyces sp. Ag82_O1-15]|nr:hypothetical protein BX281_8013 [Streptomyces sp. Ag82_O1-15]